ncbi:MAG: glycosyl hydrolase family 5, partial [Cyanobacteria bacterium P01_A01_bin.17]
MDNWKWTNPKYREVEGQKGLRLFRSTDTDLAFDVSVEVRTSPQKMTLTWDYRFQGPTELRAGTTIKFVDSQGRLLGSQLNPDFSGLSFGVPGLSNDVVRVQTSPALAGLHYERGRKNEIRAYRYTPDAEALDKRISMQIKLPHGCRFEAPVSQRLAKPDRQSWVKVPLTAQNTPPSTPFGSLYMDLSKRPTASGEVLLDGTGQPIRYWGTNITASALFSTPTEEIKRQAKRLRGLGFNLVRLTHIDSNWVNPNIFGVQDSVISTRRIAKTSIEAIDRWIAALKEEGVAIWLDLHVGRRFKDQDGIRFFDELKKDKRGQADSRGFIYINETIQERWKEFASAFLGHINPLTGLRYAEDPAVIVVQITNENDLSHHFGNFLLPNKNVPKHNAIYMRLARIFANEHSLNLKQTWRSWEQGPSKLFLADLEHKFNEGMVTHIRSLGFDGLISTTSSWGGMPLSGHLSLTDGDIIDVHSYDSPGFLSANPATRSNSAHWLAMGQVAGMPMTVSEWNISPYPAY